jgi:membrane-associated protein
MDESDERGQLQDLVARRWGALFKWLAFVVAGIAVVVILVSLGGDDGFGQLQADNPTRTYFLVFFLIAADAVVPIFPGETTLNAASAISSSGS